jgi:tetratricopeptide (TPR) repeat protein
MEEAKGYFDQAMELLDMLPGSKENQEQRISLLVNQLNVFLLLLKTPEYYDLLTRYEPLLAKSGSPGLRGAFYARLGACEWWFGYLDQAIQTLTKSAELCEAAGNAEDAALAYAYLQWSCLVKGDSKRALTLNENILRKMDERFDLRWYVWALGGASWANAILGRWDEAEELGQKALAVAQEFSDNSLISLAAGQLSHVYTDKGDMNLAIEYGELAVAKAPTLADHAMSQFYLARIWCRSGQPQRGIDVLSASLQVFRAARLAPMELHGLSSLGFGYWLAGEHDKASQTAEELLRLAERSGTRGYVGIAHALLGEVALECKLAEAVTHFEKYAEISQETKAENGLATAYSGMGRFHKQEGNTEKAREYLTRALEIFERLGTLISPDMVRNELAELGD